MCKNILLCVDESAPAMRAAGLAGELARCLASDLCILTCFEPIPEYLGQPNLQRAINERIIQAEKVIAATKAELGEIPGVLSTEILEGPAAKSILKVAQTRRIDVIIMGTRGLGQLSGLLLGSQSQKVVAQADCAVLLTR